MGYTSTEVKRRYNDSVYKHTQFYIPIKMKESFKEKCSDYDTSMRQVVLGIINEYLENNNG